ncbi:arsenic resistance N-acetyltransferase ArsN2 [Pseudoduganella sp. HUAS MS19]
MSLELEIRNATGADWRAIETLLADSGLPVEGAREHLDFFIVGASGSEIRCVAGIELYGSVALLRSVAVSKALRGQGVGDRLLHAIRSKARAEGAATLYLLTTTAAAFFGKRGFRQIERSNAPDILKASREFQGVCPASATLMVESSGTSHLPVAVLGAGPVGLAAAAHLIARGFTPLVFERGESAGANLNSYRHVRLFSPWQYNIDKTARRMLDAHGWTAPADDQLPTAGEVVDAYLQPLASLPELAHKVYYAHRVIRITRDGFDKVRTRGREAAPFVIRTQSASGERDHKVLAVIDATGTWSQPNPLGADGLPAFGEDAMASRIDYGMPDVLGEARPYYAGRRVLVVGAGHSAAGNLLALAKLAEEVPGTEIVWAMRGNRLAKVFGGGDADGLPARGQLGARLKALKESGRLELHTDFRISALQELGGSLTVEGTGADGGARSIDGIARIIASTGARPNLDLTRELRVRHDPWLESTDALAPLIDPNEHSCGTVRPHGHRELAHPEPGYYAVGAKSYGRAPNFLMATGYEQVRSVVAALAGDFAAADDVRLELPETGVCNIQFVDSASGGATGCCGGPAPAGSEACCALDAEEKAKGASGCTSSGTCKPRRPESSGCCA